jgi:hypothetical protein
MSNIDLLEQRLAEAYRRQAKHYDEALCIVNENVQPFELSTWANDLQSALQQIANIEQDMAGDKLVWKSSNRTPSVELRKVLANVATQIQNLANAIDRRSQEVSARKQRLLPALDEFIRHRHMLQSYGRHAKAK